MILPVADSGGVEVILNGIEDGLRALAGFEKFWSRLESNLDEGIEAMNVWLDDSTQPRPNRVIDQSFTVPGPFGCTVVHDYYELPQDYGNTLKRLQSEADSYYDWGAEGFGLSLQASRALARKVMKPDATALGDSALDMAHTADFLSRKNLQGMPGFVDDLKASWPASSLSSNSFYAFYGDLAELCANYYIAAAALATTTALVGNALAQYQQNLLDVLNAADQHVGATLKGWAINHGPYFAASETETEDGSTAAEILDYTSLGLGAAAFIPVPGADVVAGVASVVTGILAHAVEGRSITTTFTKAATAAAIHAGIIDAVQKLVEQVRLALSAARTGGTGPITTDHHGPSFEDIVRGDADRSDWTPHRVDL